MERGLLIVLLLAAFALGWQLRGRWRPRRRRAPLPPASQLRRWLEHAPEGWLVLAPDRRLAWLNARAEQLLELEPDQLRTGEPLAAFDPSDEVLHLIDLTCESHQPQRGTWKRPGRNNLEVVVLGGDDNWLALLLAGRHQLEAQLEQQERWVSDVAHELKTPITALMLVGDTIAARAEGQQAVLVGRLQKELRRLQLLVSDLLDLSRLENTAMEALPSTSAVAVSGVLRSAWSVLEPLAQERQISLQRIIPTPPQPSPLVAVEASRLHQALLNLLDNALRYSPDGAPIEVSVSPRERWCQISVRDHGPGLSATDLQHLFERFYRGDPSRFRGPRTGSGLGLAIVQQIALAHGGLVRARNHPGGGAVLELLLPRN
jgi:two-component system phosphate regulon sensor histidine kinase PhoR